MSKVSQAPDIYRTGRSVSIAPHIHEANYQHRKFNELRVKGEGSFTDILIVTAAQHGNQCHQKRTDSRLDKLKSRKLPASAWNTSLPSSVRSSISEGSSSGSSHSQRRDSSRSHEHRRDSSHRDSRRGSVIKELTHIEKLKNRKLSKSVKIKSKVNEIFQDKRLKRDYRDWLCSKSESLKCWGNSCY